MKLQEPDNPRTVDYFDAVKHHMLDVPWNQRQSLLSELVVRLDELPVHTDPAAVLGAPEDCARLMREAAGYPPQPARRFAYIRAWRLRRKIIVATTLAVVLVLVATAVGGGIWITHYQPLSASTTVFGPVQRDVREIQPNVPARGVFFEYRSGAEFDVGVDIRNSGRATATITGFGPSGALLEPVQLRLGAPNQCCLWNSSTPVTRVTIEPGHEVLVFLILRVKPNRILKGDWMSEDPPKLQTKVLGVHHLLSVGGPTVSLTGS